MTRLPAQSFPHIRPPSSTSLRGRRLVAARITWLFLVALFLVLFLLMLPAFFEVLRAVCTNAACVSSQPARDAVHILQVHGLTLTMYALFIIILLLVVTLACSIVGILIFWRRSDDWMALLVSLILMAPGDIYATYTLQQTYSSWHVPALILIICIFALIFLFFSTFPDGHFVPRWTCWPIVGWLVWGIIMLFLPISYPSYLAHNIIWLCIFSCSVGSQIYRYDRLSGPFQRQQTKWVVYGACLSIMCILGLKIPNLLFPSLGSGSLYSLIAEAGLILALLPMPLAISFAVMHSGLWDVDIILKRTLVYALLTALVALVYFGGVALLQALFRTFSGLASPLAVFCSTLAIAVLFQPLYTVLQRIIDALFYRSKYSASQVLARLSFTVRACLSSGDEESLDLLTGTIQRIVKETLQPAHATLWLYTLAPSTEEDTQKQEALSPPTVHSPKEGQVSMGQAWDEQLSQEKKRRKQRHRAGKRSALLNYALLYSVLGGMFGLLSFAIVLFEQQLAHVLPSWIAELFIVGSLLVLIRSFKTVRRRLQVLLARHLARHRYYAEQRLHDFTMTLRHETNGAQLRASLLEVVSDVLEIEPTAVSLWTDEEVTTGETPRYTGVLR